MTSLISTTQVEELIYQARKIYDDCFDSSAQDELNNTIQIKFGEFNSLLENIKKQHRTSSSNLQIRDSELSESIQTLVKAYYSLCNNISSEVDKIARNSMSDIAHEHSKDVFFLNRDTDYGEEFLQKQSVFKSKVEGIVEKCLGLKSDTLVNTIKNLILPAANSYIVNYEVRAEPEVRQKQQDQKFFYDKILDHDIMAECKNVADISLFDQSRELALRIKEIGQEMPHNADTLDSLKNIIMEKLIAGWKQPGLTEQDKIDNYFVKKIKDDMRKTMCTDIKNTVHVSLDEDIVLKRKLMKILEDSIADNKKIIQEITTEILDQGSISNYMRDSLEGALKVKWEKIDDFLKQNSTRNREISPGNLLNEELNKSLSNHLENFKKDIDNAVAAVVNTEENTVFGELNDNRLDIMFDALDKLENQEKTLCQNVINDTKQSIYSTLTAKLDKQLKTLDSALSNHIRDHALFQNIPNVIQDSITELHKKRVELQDERLARLLQQGTDKEILSNKACSGRQWKSFSAPSEHFNQSEKNKRGARNPS